MLYGDQQISLLEQELWHTADFQRLYFIRQLGFSDKVFPDAIHNRFNHVVGTCQRAEDIVLAAARQTQPGNVSALAAKPGIGGDASRLRAHIEARVDVARLMALLHDLSHIPFGHTLEDELHLFRTKHDARDRQVRMFNRITAQFIRGLYDDVIGLWPQTEEPGSHSKEQVLRLAEELADASRQPDCPPQLRDFGAFLANLFAAQTALVVMHHSVDGATRGSLLAQVLSRIGISPEPFDPIFDYFLIDAIGNTICADLLDYSRRDMRMANIIGDYDDRLFRWFVLSEVPTEKDMREVRLAIKVFSNKFKPDILREILKVLELRYDLAERILFHPAKCCAGAMLGRAVEALGLGDSVQEMLSMGDEVFLGWISSQLASAHLMLAALGKGRDGAAEFGRIHPDVRRGIGARLGVVSPDSISGWKALPEETTRTIRSELEAGVALMDRLRSRHYYQLAYEVTTEADDARGTEISTKYMNGLERTTLMREVEAACGLPPGTVLIHCPRRKTNFKEAEALILFSPSVPAVPLCKTEAPQLKRIVQRARDMAEDYKSIWRLRVYTHKAYRHQAASVASYLSDVLGAANSRYLEASLAELPYYQQGVGFLRRFGGQQGREMIARAVEEMRAARKGTDGKRVSFEECLRRQAEGRDRSRNGRARASSAH